MPFRFRRFERLTDGVVDLVLERQEPADPARGHVPCYYYRIVDHESRTPVGTIRLRVGPVSRTPSLLTSGHVGYEVDEARRGYGYAARGCALLAPVARAHGLRRVVITCDPENLASRRTCERLGAAFVGIFDVPTDHPMFQKGRRRVCRYVWTLGASAPTRGADGGPDGPGRPGAAGRRSRPTAHATAARGP
jgi:predicted acetyltransferase